MTYYVKRLREATEAIPGGDFAKPARAGWTGPIRSERQARKEAAAWESEGWLAWVEESTPPIKREVRAWLNGRKT